MADISAAEAAAFANASVTHLWAQTCVSQLHGLLNARFRGLAHHHTCSSVLHGGNYTCGEQHSASHKDMMVGAKNRTFGLITDFTGLMSIALMSIANVFLGPSPCFLVSFCSGFFAAIRP